MKLAATLLLLATACAPSSSHTAVPVSGKARTTTTQAATTTTAPATTTTAPTTTVAVVVPATAAPAVIQGPGILARIAECESGGSYTVRNPTSSASGKYQFLTSTWQAWGDPRWPTAADAPPAVQEAAALRLFNELGTRPWNASRHCWGNA